VRIDFPPAAFSLSSSHCTLAGRFNVLGAMMLRLYHYWSSVCSQKVRMCLAEKGLDWESRHVDIFAFENYEQQYTRLNPKAVVPTLDHDGHVLIESNIILEYIEDLYPNQVPLRPADPFERSIMRLWIYNSEELAHWNVNVCSHNLRHAKRMDQRYTHEQQIAAAEKCPNPMIALRLKRRLAVGVSVEEEDEAYAKLDYLLDQMEHRLGQAPWIAGAMFTLADIAMAPMVNRIEVLARPEMIAPGRRPKVADWWQRIQARPGYKTAFSFKNPDSKDPIKR
jgi:glutathione S-transferase